MKIDVIMRNCPPGVATNTQHHHSQNKRSSHASFSFLWMPGTSEHLFFLPSHINYFSSTNFILSDTMVLVHSLAPQEYLGYLRSKSETHKLSLLRSFQCLERQKSKILHVIFGTWASKLTWFCPLGAVGHEPATWLSLDFLNTK